MIDTSLIERLKVLARKERKVKEFKRRLRVKGKITAKGTTKKGNITLTIKKGDEEYKFTVLKSHRERFALAGKLNAGKSVYAQGIPKLRMIICTGLKERDKGTEEGRQAKLEAFA